MRFYPSHSVISTCLEPVSLTFVSFSFFFFFGARRLRSSPVLFLLLSLLCFSFFSRRDSCPPPLFSFLFAGKVWCKAQRLFFCSGDGTFLLSVIVFPSSLPEKHTRNSLHPSPLPSPVSRLWKEFALLLPFFPVTFLPPFPQFEYSLGLGVES